MKEKSKAKLSVLREYYKDDNDSLSLLKEIEESDNDIHDLKILREHPKIELLINEIRERFKRDLSKLVDDTELTEKQRLACQISMDWAKWFMNAIGGDIKTLENEIDDRVDIYMKKSGLST